MNNSGIFSYKKSMFIKGKGFRAVRGYLVARNKVVSSQSSEIYNRKIDSINTEIPLLIKKNTD